MAKRSGVSIRSYAAAVAPRNTVEVIEASEVDMQLEIDESERATIQTTLETRPINTKRKYEAYQKEYVQWCTTREFRDRDTVSGGKLHLFLSSMVIGRKSKMNSEKTIGGSTVCGYTNAIVDLYNQQVALRTNSNQHPRTPAVKQLIKNVQTQTTATKKKNYEDRGIGSLLDGYSSADQFQQICNTFFSLDDIRGRTAFLLSHFGLLRGENIRDLEFADMFSQKLDGEGYQSCIALVILVQHGKTNTFGKLQHVGYMRNKDVHICPVGAAAMYFFQLFHIDREPFPCFRIPQDWYDTKLLRGRQRDKSITYETHKASYEAVFKYLGLTFNKKTHINRQQGVRHLESADVDISQTRRHGRWGMDTCEAVYAAPLAREAMRALSGHPPRSRLYYLERASVDPPLERQQLVFPDVELCETKMLEGIWEENLAARGFLQLLRYLRSVFLQDAAVLYDLLPSRFQQHQILGDAFHHFRAQALEVAATAKSPVEMQLQVAMPLLSAQISKQHAEIMQRLESNQAKIAQVLTETNTSLTSILHGQMEFRLVPLCTTQTTSAAAGTQISSSVQRHTPMANTETSTTCDVPNYSMSRGICTVRELWTEWHVGLSGYPSIAHLESTYGCKWRSSSKEAKFFSRRLRIVKYVRSLISAGQSAEAAIDRAEEERGTRSIDAFSKHLHRKKSV